MVTNFLFKARDGQTPLPKELQKDLKIKNIQTLGELDQFEEENIAEGIFWLERSKLPPLNYSFIIKLHRKLFGNVWKWAGQIRNHELNNPDFTRPQQIRTELSKLISDSEFWFSFNTYPKNEIIARIHERLLTIHPFANGNGRWSRILTEYICLYYKIDTPTWNERNKKSPKKRRSQYIEAIELARYKKQYKNLAEIIFN